MEVFLLYHRNYMDDGYYDSKIIGVYSSYENATNRINTYKKLPGFSDYPSGFRIESFEISSKSHKKRKTVDVVIGERAFDDDDDITVSYHICSNRFCSLMYLLKNFKNRKQLGTKFYFDKYSLDEDNWREGFVVIED